MRGCAVLLMYTNGHWVVTCSIESLESVNCWNYDLCRTLFQLASAGNRATLRNQLCKAQHGADFELLFDGQIRQVSQLNWKSEKNGWKSALSWVRRAVVRTGIDRATVHVALSGYNAAVRSMMVMMMASSTVDDRRPPVSSAASVMLTGWLPLNLQAVRWCDGVRSHPLPPSTLGISFQ